MTNISVRKSNPASEDKKVLGLPAPATYALAGMVISGLFVSRSKSRAKNRERLLKYGLVGAIVGAGVGTLVDAKQQ